MAEDGTPECVVGYVDANNSRGTPDVAMPACSDKCCGFFATEPHPGRANDPTLLPNPQREAEVAACSGNPDCYCAVKNPHVCQEERLLGLWREGGAPPRPGKVVSI